MNAPPKHANDIAHTATGCLTKITDKCRQLMQLQYCLESVLPEEIKPHCRVMNVAHHHLTLGANSAAWATNIRFLEPTIKTALQEAGYDMIQKITVKVLEPAGNTAIATAEPRKPDQAVAEDMVTMADSITNENLRSALKQLGKDLQE